MSDLRQHERLIDHFKRVYSIVAGLALTEACRRTLPIDSVSDPRLWMFLTLFVTLVPIFHGGDRSLDQKYHDAPPKTSLGRFGFIWDDYMLLLTAVLFVCIAESIPLLKDEGAQTDFTPGRFYSWLSTAFFFDVFVLAVDYAKNWSGRARLKPYPAWIVLNLILGLIGSDAAHLAFTDFAAKTVRVPVVGDMDLLTLSLLVFAAAAARTLADYYVGSRAGFLLPGAGRAPANP